MNQSPSGKRWSAVPLPCPSTLWWQFGSSRAADLKGTMSYRIQGKSVRLFVRLSICPSVHSLYPPPPQPASHLDGWTDGQTDRWTYTQISPVFYRTSSPLGPLPCLLPNRPHSVDERVLLTISCLWATGSFLPFFLPFSFIPPPPPLFLFLFPLLPLLLSSPPFPQFLLRPSHCPHILD